jgi:uncharacterized membrane protein YeaQ/YmgE (transglycosylase-associated protein family)
MFGVIGWIVFGLIVGAIAKLLMPGKDPGGFIVTILIGIAGALVGGFVGRAVGLYREGEPAGFFMAVLGSILLLFLYRVFTRGRAGAS